MKPKVNCNGCNNHYYGISKLQCLGNMTCSSELDRNARCKGNFIILRSEFNICWESGFVEGEIDFSKLGSGGGDNFFFWIVVL